ncbi:MAG: Hsp33 family molecular chaperone HslO [Nitrososphaerales archaeon]
MGDYVLRVLAKDAGVRVLTCTTTELSREAARRHAAYPIAAAALAYGMTAGALLGALLKVQERVALKFDGDGRLGKMIIESDAYGRARGYIAVPDAAAGKSLNREAVGDALGRTGVLTVVKDLRLKDLYRSAIPIEYGELDKELENYLNQSEQIPSLVEIGVVMNEDQDIEVSGGWLIQALPGHGHEAVEQLAMRTEGQPAVEAFLAEGADPEQLMDRLLPDHDYIVLDRTEIRFSCSCSKERSAKALRILAPEDRLALIAEGEAIVDCHFCHARYTFTRGELETLHEEALRDEEAARAEGETSTSE